MKQVLWVALGGALGAVCRFGFGKWLQGLNPHPSFSAGTLVANLLGCFLMGALVTVFGRLEDAQQQFWAAFFLTGFLGSLTTFSTFILEMFKLAQSEGWKLTISHSAAHLVIGFAGLWLGHLVAQKI